LREGSDRAAAVLGALYAHYAVNNLIEAHLEDAPKKALEELTSSDGPLYSFGSAILLCWAMGLIDEESKRQLNTIRNIRNTFAHSYKPVTFETQSVIDSCLSFKIKDEDFPDLSGLEAGLAARLRYLAAVFTESLALQRKINAKMNRRHAQLKRKLKRLESKLREHR
jgi:DNA-binding MltR family transcriptional regulator